MVQANRGTKRHCSHCGANYYDLGRTPVICPKCHVAFVAAPTIPLRAAGSRSRAEPPPPRDEEEVETVEAFADDEAIDHDSDEAAVIDDDDEGDEQMDEMRE